MAEPSEDSPINPAPDEARQLARDYAVTFTGRAGAAVLAHLESLTTGRVLGPEASDALLRHVEGQRALLTTVRGLIRRGQSGE